MARFDNARALAVRLIAKNGRKVTFRVLSTTPVNPAEPWGPNTPDTDIKNVDAVFVEYQSPEIDGTLIQQGDKKCLIAKLSLPNIDPKIENKIVESNGSTWNIVRINTLQPGGLDETIMYTIQVRA